MDLFENGISAHLAEFAPRSVEMRLGLADAWLGDCCLGDSLDATVDLVDFHDVADCIR